MGTLDDHLSVQSLESTWLNVESRTNTKVLSSPRLQFSHDAAESFQTLVICEDARNPFVVLCKTQTLVSEDPEMLRMLACLLALGLLVASLSVSTPFVLETLPHWIGALHVFVTFGLGVGVVVGLFIWPLYCWREHESKRGRFAGPQGIPPLLVCPTTGTVTENLKQFRIVDFVLCLGIFVGAEWVVFTSTPAEMRRFIRRTFWRVLIPGNFMALVLTPCLAMLYCLTYEPGHSFIAAPDERWIPASANDEESDFEPEQDARHVFVA